MSTATNTPAPGRLPACTSTGCTTASDRGATGHGTASAIRGRLRRGPRLGGIHSCADPAAVSPAQGGSTARPPWPCQPTPPGSNRDRGPAGTWCTRGGLGNRQLGSTSRSVISAGLLSALGPAVRRGFQFLDSCPFGHADLEVTGRLLAAETWWRAPGIYWRSRPAPGA